MSNTLIEKSAINIYGVHKVSLTDRDIRANDFESTDEITNIGAD